MCPPPSLFSNKMLKGQRKFQRLFLMKDFMEHQLWSAPQHVLYYDTDHGNPVSRVSSGYDKPSSLLRPYIAPCLFLAIIKGRYEEDFGYQYMCNSPLFTSQIQRHLSDQFSSKFLQNKWGFSLQHLWQTILDQRQTEWPQLGWNIA